MKVCAKCGVEKPIENFAKDVHAPDGRQYRCRQCHREHWASYYSGRRDELIENRQNYRRNTGELRRRRYGITKEQVEAMRETQNNKCACCGEQFAKEPSLDHDHKTGKNRALLCHSCNVGIGFFNDSALRCFLAASYLQKFH